MSKHTRCWWKVIQEAKKHKAKGLKPFTTEHKDAASDWPDCACGKQDARIPRDSDGVPLDGFLRVLGCEFVSKVFLDLPDAAEITLLAIEARAAELLEELKGLT